MPEAVKGTVQQWLESRDLTGLKNPAYFLLHEFDDNYAPANRPKHEYTIEEIAAIRGQLDRENEAIRIAIMNRKPAPVLTAVEL